MIRILIVDDQQVIREKLLYMFQQVFDIQVVGTATDGDSALQQIEVLRPDIVLMDIHMPNMNGINVTKIISRKFLDTKVIIFSDYDGEEYVAKSMEAGAKIFLSKSLPASEIKKSIRLVSQGYPEIIDSEVPWQLAKGNSVEANSSTSNSIRTNNSRSNSFETLEVDSKNRLDLDSNNSAIVITSESWNKHKSEQKFRWKHWLIGWAVLNVSVWGLTLLCFKFKPPIYTSEWSVILPGKAKIKLDLPSVGQADFGTDNSVEDFDPRNNILYMASNLSVLSKAAMSVNLSLADFGEPEIELVDDSSIIAFSIEGNTPKEAQSKAFALQQSMLKQIEFLKVSQAKQDAEKVRSERQVDQNKLQELRQRLNKHRIDSNLISSEQINNLAEQLEDLRQQKSQVERELQEANNSIEILSDILKLSPQQAVDASSLQSDRLFQQYLQEYSQLSANFIGLQSRFTFDAPTIQNEQEKLKEVETALLNRGSLVLSKPVERTTLEKLKSKSSDGSRDKNEDEESMMKKLAATWTARQNQIVKRQSLDNQIQELNSRLKYLAREQLPLENLQREADFAEAILTSKVAQVDVKDDALTFPAIQLLSEPNLPDKASNSDIKTLLLANIVFTVISLAGLLLLHNEKKNSVWND